MNNFLKSAGIVLGVIVLFLGLTWVIMGNDFFLYKFFAPKVEQVRRETFEQSKAYNQGVIQELQNMQFEYAKADSSHQMALGSIILHRAADYDLEKMPVDLRQFIEKLKMDQMQPMQKHQAAKKNPKY